MTPPGGMGSRGAPIDRWIESAGGVLRVPIGKIRKTDTMRHIPVMGATGALIATIQIGSVKDPVAIVLPDGRVATMLRPVGLSALRGNAGEIFGEAECHMESIVSWSPLPRPPAAHSNGTALGYWLGDGAPVISILAGGAFWWFRWRKARRSKPHNIYDVTNTHIM